MPQREITLQIVLAFLFGAILLDLGLRGRVGSGLAAIFAPDKLQEGDFSGGNTDKTGTAANSANSNLLNIIIGFFTNPFGGVPDNPPTSLPR